MLPLAPTVRSPISPRPRFRSTTPRGMSCSRNASAILSGRRPATLLCHPRSPDLRARATLSRRRDPAVVGAKNSSNSNRLREIGISMKAYLPADRRRQRVKASWSKAKGVVVTALGPARRTGTPADHRHEVKTSPPSRWTAARREHIEFRCPAGVGGRRRRQWSLRASQACRSAPVTCGSTGETPLARARPVFAASGKHAGRRQIADQLLEFDSACSIAEYYWRCDRRTGAPAVLDAGGEGPAPPRYAQDRARFPAAPAGARRFVILCTNALLLSKKIDGDDVRSLVHPSRPATRRCDKSVCLDGAHEKAVAAIKLARKKASPADRCPVRRRRSGAHRRVAAR